MARNWDELPMDLLMDIAMLLTRFEDYAPFSGVCTSWQSAAACLYPIPLLMLAPRKDSHVLDFYHLSDRIVNQVSLSEDLTGKRCYSSKGCLITIGHDLNVNLMHPFSNIQHTFPNIKTIDNWDENCDSSSYHRLIYKCVLSSNPLLEYDYILMVILEGYTRLVYARPGDETWTFLGKRATYSDITYCRGQFYMVNPAGQISTCFIGGGNNPNEPEVVAELPSKLRRNKSSRLYIVESAGALLIISRFVYDGEIKLTFFDADDDDDDDDDGDGDEDDDDDDDGDGDGDEDDDDGDGDGDEDGDGDAFNYYFKNIPRNLDIATMNIAGDVCTKDRRE
ncbi:hypothetical protein Ddye_031361 [Dipteronia dyeriana]|uniref:KIB1-4 beta-propeller domain-containing protein n=1 Tax=Dipteronia dyeriana TaxID=168575 RepID=A0AAD9WMA2_9ROSI|nr:hypothetical protein Ddye_031361 [Dipteronia dyeriana]